MSDVLFRRDGRQFLTASHDGTVRLWDLAPDERDVTDLERMTWLISGRKLRPAEGTVPLKPSELQSVFADLRARYPRELVSPDDQRFAWHQREAAASEQKGQWFTALFHTEHLMALRPGSEELRQQRARILNAQGIKSR